MPGSIQSVQRAAAIVQLIADNPGRITLTDVAESLGLAKTTAHGLLRTLIEVGFVVAGSGPAAAGHGYSLGPALLELGDSRLDSNEMRSHAVNWSDALAMRSGHAVQVAAWSGETVRIVHHVFRPDDSAQQLLVGRPLPVHATALGKVLLAWNPVLSRHTRSEFDRFSARTITSPTELARSLVLVRSLGWAAETEEHQRGRASIAAPIRRSGGQVVAAIGIDGELDRLCEPSGRPRAALVAQVRHAAAAVSRDLATSRR